EDGALGDAALERDVLHPSAAVPVLGELSHRGIDDPVAPIDGIRGPPAAPLGHALHGSGKKNPRDLQLAGNRSSQPPSASRALMPQAPSTCVTVVGRTSRRGRVLRPSAAIGSSWG